MFIIALCSMRAANGFTCFLAYTSLLIRILQFIGVIIRKREMSMALYSIATFFIVLMFFADFASESADIVHESMPTDDMIDDLTALRFNYNRGFRGRKGGNLLL